MAVPYHSILPNLYSKGLPADGPAKLTNREAPPNQLQSLNSNFWNKIYEDIQKHNCLI